MFNFVKILFVFVAVFALASAWPAVETPKEETKSTTSAVIKAPTTKAAAAIKEVSTTKAHHQHTIAQAVKAAKASETEEQVRPKRSCKSLSFTSRSGRKVEGNHGC